MSLLTHSTQYVVRAQKTLKSLRDVHWNACAFSQRCPTKTIEPNEDAAVIIPLGPDSLVLAVADGCGGMRGGEQASRIAVRHLARAVRRCRHNAGSMRGAIMDGIEEANEAIQALKIGAACTIAAVEYACGKVRSYHVGDSMILVSSNRGRVRYQSLCHSPVAYAVESGLLDEQDAMYHEDRNLISNFVGSPRMRIEVGPWVKLSQHDRVVIASDGLFDNLMIEEIVAHMQRRTPEEYVRELSRLATKRMVEPSGTLPSKPDDLTILTLKRNA